ncbi:MAG: plasmid pRiA4b ORF-3 family protein [Rhodopirellula sp.]|nr:plasmid pRiA4b ORF-3 family protein [Rhodopirellula sp.]
MPRAKKPSVAQAELLRKQTIGPDGPGTILRDFESLLDFIGPEGLRTTGKYHFLPLSRLLELDAKMAKPLRPGLSRPQQRSFPHLTGLYLLLRTTEFALAKGEGQAGRLVLNPAMVDQWRTLNWTEKYFNLLEAWLRFASRETLGERESGFFSDSWMYDAVSVWRRIPPGGITFEKGARSEGFLHSSSRTCSVALLEMFGMAKAETTKPQQGEAWRILALRRSPWGEALLELLLPGYPDEILQTREVVVGFGHWQALLAEYFPDWRNNLHFPELELRNGVFVFQVSVADVWRRIAIPAEGRLEDLAWAIIQAFEFDGEHLFEFIIRELDGTTTNVVHPEIEGEAFTDEYAIGYLPLEEGDRMMFRYDFGANWEFQVRLEEVKPPDPEMQGPALVESHGEAPPEYDCDDW